MSNHAFFNIVDIPIENENSLFLSVNILIIYNKALLRYIVESLIFIYIFVTTISKKVQEYI